MKPVAYLDADILLYRACSFADSDFDGEVMGDWRQAMSNFVSMRDRWLKAVKHSDYFLVFTTRGNFRYGLYPEYKAHRKSIPPHPAMRELKNELLTLQESIWEDGIEADDLIGIRCTESQNTVAVSADKDFATVPCKLYVPASHGRTEGQWFSPTEDEANLSWMRQALMGDVTDNYKGIPKMGPVKAAKALPNEAPVEVLWTWSKAAFKKAGLSEEYALTMMRLARILRTGEYDFETKEVKLWEPPSMLMETLSKSQTTVSTPVPRT